MKKLLFGLIVIFSISSCDKPKKTYYSITIVKDSFGGKVPEYEERIDTILVENDSLAMIKNYSSYLISHYGDMNRTPEDAKFLKSETIDYKLLDKNKNVIVNTLPDNVKKEIENQVKSVVNQTTVYEPEPTNPEEQFSKWDGSHKKLTEYIKSQMNNPDSYEHVSTKAATKSSHILVVTTIRGENAYGATITTTYEAKVDKDNGDVISISQQ